MYPLLWGFPGGSVVRICLPMQETQVRSLGQEDPLEEEMATHSSIFAWRIPWTEEPGGLPSIKLQRAGYDCSDWAHTQAKWNLALKFYCPIPKYMTNFSSKITVNTRQHQAEKPCLFKCQTQYHWHITQHLAHSRWSGRPFCTSMNSDHGQWC